VEVRRVTDIDKAVLRGVELLVVGSPTQGGRPTAATKAFLDAIGSGALRDIEVAAFDTRVEPTGLLKLFLGVIGYAAGRIAKALQAKGGRLLAPPEGFIVEGKEGPLRADELARAIRWACKLQKTRTTAKAA
jgi:hypothetical protein